MAEVTALEVVLVEVTLEVGAMELEVASVEVMGERLIMENNAEDILILYCDVLISKLFI